MNSSDRDNTKTGRKWETWAINNIFPNAVLQLYNNRAFDILDDKTRIDVKSSRLFTKKKGRYFDFLVKYNTGCDYFLFIGYRYQRDKNPLKVWLIPAHLVNNRRRITIGQNHTGRWEEFEIKLRERTK